MSNVVKTLSLAIALTLVLLLADRNVSAQPERTIPMWEGLEKNAIQKKIDRDFVSGMIKHFDGNADKASHYAVLKGWEQIEKGDLETAIKRFNQAWLLNPERGDIYWGFVVASAERGDELAKIEQWFAKAESIVGPQTELYSDWGIVLERRDKPNAAIPYFLKSIELKPNNPEPHAGMVRTSVAIGDRKTAEKHSEIYRALTQ